MLDQIVVALELREQVEFAHLGLVQLAGQVLLAARELLVVVAQVLDLPQLDLELLGALCATNRIRVHILERVAAAHAQSSSSGGAQTALLARRRCRWRCMRRAFLIIMVWVCRRLLQLFLKLLDDQLALLQLLPSQTQKKAYV